MCIIGSIEGRGASLVAAHQPVTTPPPALRDGDYLESDVASAVKRELVIDPTPAADGTGNEVSYDFVLDPARGPDTSSNDRGGCVLFAVKVDIPLDVDPKVRTDTLAREQAYSHELQRSGKWVHIWRIVGQYSNLSVFDVADNGELHDILWGLPLFPYMTTAVTPPASHPSDLALALDDGKV